MSSVADYIATRLRDHCARHLFGIPGTSCAAFFEAAIAAGVEPILTSNELEAGYAADAYARFAGLAAVSVSYGVGTLSLANAIAGALVERSPVVVVNGGPSAYDDWSERELGVLFSHSTGRPRTDLQAFALITAFAGRAAHAAEVPAMVDTALSTAIREQRPVYIEIPADLWKQPCEAPSAPLDGSRPAAGGEADIASAIARAIEDAERPAVLVGVEVQRYGLASAMAGFLARSRLPWATTLLAKTALPEQTPGFVGVYDSDLAPKPVRELIEGADRLIAFGCCFGIDHRFLVASRRAAIVHLYDGFARFGASAPLRAELEPVLAALGGPVAEDPAAAPAKGSGFRQRRTWTGPLAAAKGEISYEDLFGALDDFLDERWMVVSDTCLGSYPAADLNLLGADAFVGNPVWLSIGHSVGAAAGAALASGRRPLVVCGDGGFQTCAQGLSTLARYRQAALVVVIDNGTYAIEQYLLAPDYFQKPDSEPLPYVGLNRWDYPALALAMGVTNARLATSLPELVEALDSARGHDGPSLVAVRVSPRSLPPENVMPLPDA